MVTTKQYTFQNVTGNHTISAEFENMIDVNLCITTGQVGWCKIRYKVGSSSTWTNITSPTVAGTTVQVPVGGSITVEAYDITTGKVFTQWVNAEPSLEIDTNPATFSELYDDTEITVVLSTATYTITATAGTGGSISPSGSVSVTHGNSQTFTVTASNGYKIKQILVDGSPIQL